MAEKAILVVDGDQIIRDCLPYGFLSIEGLSGNKQADVAELEMQLCLNGVSDWAQKK